MNHNITQVAERAVRGYIVDHLPEWLPEHNVFRGIENSETQEMEGQESSLLLYPCVIANCSSAAAILQNWSGLWTVNLSVEVYNHRTKVTGDDHDARSAAVFGLFSTTTIARDLSNAIESFRIAGVIPQSQSRRFEGYAWVSVMEYQLAHCATFE